MRFVSFSFQATPIKFKSPVSVPITAIFPSPWFSSSDPTFLETPDRSTLCVCWRGWRTAPCLRNWVLPPLTNPTRTPYGGQSTSTWRRALYQKGRSMSQHCVSTAQTGRCLTGLGWCGLVALAQEDRALETDIAHTARLDKASPIHSKVRLCY